MRARERRDFSGPARGPEGLCGARASTTCSTQPWVALALSHKISLLPDLSCAYVQMHLWLRSYSRNHHCVILKYFHPIPWNYCPSFFRKSHPLYIIQLGNITYWRNLRYIFFFPSQRINIKKWSISFQIYFFFPFLMIFFKFTEAINKHQGDGTTPVAL